jgi:sugar lactone lactonase YvrE
VAGSLIDVDVSGKAVLGNGFDGIQIGGASTGNLIGGTSPLARNVIGGNGRDGILLRDAGTSGNTIQGNSIGMGVDGQTAAGNGTGTSGGMGVALHNGASNNTIGGTAAGAGNTIATNQQAGVLVGVDPTIPDFGANPGGTGNRIWQNSIVANGPSANGIALGTPSQAPATDPNSPLQVPPRLLNFTRVGGQLLVSYSFTGVANGSYRIEFFFTNGGPSGLSNGQVFAGSVTIQTDGTGAGQVSPVSLTVPAFPFGVTMTATATDLGASSRGTSWYSNVLREGQATGTITTVAGNGTLGFNGDGGPATAAELYNPQGVAVDGQGNLFVADTYNQRIRRVDHGTGVITTVAGNGTAGFGGDNGPATAAQFNLPAGLSLDGQGNLFIADFFNSRIRRVDHSTGVITTVAGNGTYGFSGDNGQATAAEIYLPAGVAVDGQGNLFIADYGNQRIRWVDHSTGVITTVAGNGTQGFSGDNGQATAAQLNQPIGVAVDGQGNLFIADYNNQRIRRVDHSTGVITTVAGNGTPGFSGDAGQATAAELYNPFGLAVDGQGNLFIADRFNHRIRRVQLAG